MNGEEGTDILEPSIRGLSDWGLPVTAFDGKLDSYATEKSKWDAMMCNLNFVDIDNVESTEPYPYPIVQIPIKLSQKKNSAWGIFATSLDKLIPEGEDLKDQVGKRLKMASRVHTYGKNDAGEDMAGVVWEVQEIVGTGKVKGNAIQQALKLLNGKTAAEFGQKVFTDPIVKSDPKVLQTIINKTFITAMEESGKVTKDKEGVYHIVEAETPAAE